jgi:hypothetical protein
MIQRRTQWLLYDHQVPFYIPVFFQFVEIIYFYSISDGVCLYVMHDRYVIVCRLGEDAIKKKQEEEEERLQKEEDQETTWSHKRPKALRVSRLWIASEIICVCVCVCVCACTYIF